MERYVILRTAARLSDDGGTPVARSAEDIAAAAAGARIAVERIPQQALAELAADEEVALVARAMPTKLIVPLDVPANAAAATDSWGIGAVGAAASKFDGKGVTVAVLDTGIDAAHPAFAGVELVQKDFSGTGNGDRQGHGTHCAGTIFGRDVGRRIGVARGVSRALIGKVLGDDGRGESNMIFEAMQWALNEDADVVSMSLGFDFPGMVEGLVKDKWPVDLATSVALEAYRGNLRMFDAIMGMFRAQAAFGGGPLVVAASGNESRREVKPDYRISVSLPAAAEDVVSVGALQQNGAAFRIASFSNSLPSVSGPGVAIVSAWPGGGLKALSGTSMACPHVAGVAALWYQSVRAAGLKASPANVRAKLFATARRGLFGADDEADTGQGLVTAP